jgi:broad specificity phosphatase PhoE
MRVIIVRHSIRKNLTDLNCGISSDGVTLIKEKMKEIEKYIETPDAIYVSPYHRTIETSYCMYSNNCTRIIDNDIRETLLEKKYIVNEQHPLAIYLNIIEEESWDDIKERCVKFFEKIANSCYENIVVVTHGGIVNVMLSLIDENYEFDKHNSNPSTYVPEYFGYFVADFSSHSKNQKNAKIIYKSF